MTIDAGGGQKNSLPSAPGGAEAGVNIKTTTTTSEVGVEDGVSDTQEQDGEDGITPEAPIDMTTPKHSKDRGEIDIPPGKGDVSSETTLAISSFRWRIASLC